MPLYFKSKLNKFDNQEDDRKTGNQESKFKVI